MTGVTIDFEKGSRKSKSVTPLELKATTLGAHVNTPPRKLDFLQCFHKRKEDEKVPRYKIPRTNAVYICHKVIQSPAPSGRTVWPNCPVTCCCKSVQSTLSPPTSTSGLNISIVTVLTYCTTCSYNNKLMLGV